MAVLRQNCDSRTTRSSRSSVLRRRQPTTPPTSATTPNFSSLKRLRSEEDPRLNLLEAVARTLEDGDMARLDAFEEWRDL